MANLIILLSSKALKRNLKKILKKHIGLTLIASCMEKEKAPTLLAMRKPYARRVFAKSPPKIKNCRKWEYFWGNGVYISVWHDSKRFC